MTGKATTTTTRTRKTWYTVAVDRTTMYEVRATSAEDAKDRVLDGQGKEFHGETTDIRATEVVKR
jgi:hypothetical protein